MYENSNKQNLEYYPFHLTGCSFPDFVKAFQNMSDCEVKEIFAFNVDFPDKMEDITSDRAKLELVAADPDASINVNGVYNGKPVAFLFTCGILMATNYGADHSFVKSMVADVREHLA